MYELGTLCLTRPLSEVSGDHFVFTLNEAASVLACIYVSEPDVPRRRSKKRDSGAYEHRDSRDDETLDETSPKKPLNGDSTIHVYVLDTSGLQLGRDIGQRHSQMLDHGRRGSGRQRVSAEHEHGLRTVRPGVKGQYR